ncbi:TPA: DUF1919 domain-containing protein [Streptococcus pneumoniae]|nr:DUF1919 domain-containing protein [Streptococcus pneumoniae]HEU8268434.1 DUF1919 domain-containing protein [Streptococcus pneumoniae]
MFIQKIKKIIRVFLRKSLVKDYRHRIQNKEFTLITSNCVGGLISHDLGLQFRSPTINMYIEAADFIQFCSHLERYLKEDLSFIEVNQDGHFVALCGDIKIYIVHYNSFEEFAKKWSERAKRVDFDQLYLMMSERDGCRYEDIVKFDTLPYKNKVIFTSKKMPEIQSAFYIPGIETKNNQKHKVKSVTTYLNSFTGKRYIDLFDFVEFLNTGRKQLSKYEK